MTVGIAEVRRQPISPLEATNPCFSPPVSDLRPKNFRPNILDNHEERRTFQQLVIEAVFSIWNDPANPNQPAGLKDIEGRFREKVRLRQREGKWPYAPV